MEIEKGLSKLNKDYVDFNPDDVEDPQVEDGKVIRRIIKPPRLPGKTIKSQNEYEEPDIDISLRVGVGMFRTDAHKYNSYDFIDREMLDEFYAGMMRHPLLNRKLEEIIFQHIEEGKGVNDLRENQEAQNLFETENGETEEELRGRIADLLDSSKTLEEVVVLSNLRLVANIANLYRGGLPFSELLSAGNTGVMRATESFEYKKGNKFSTYATWWIKQRITKEIYETSSAVKLPVHQEINLGVIRKFINEYVLLNGENPTVSEIMDATEKERMPRAWIKFIIKAAISGSLATLESTETPLRKDGTSHILSNIIADNAPRASVERVVTDRIITEDRMDIFRRVLTQREQAIMDMRFGLTDDVEHTLKEIGTSLGISKEKVKQFQNSALKKLRKPLERMGYSGNIQEL